MSLSLNYLCGQNDLSKLWTMKKFELKFYRDWYYALAELSREERANAALALLEYVYDGKIPEDKFIRIVTTLMRNKIDREKEAFENVAIRKNKRLPNELAESNQPTVNELEASPKDEMTEVALEPNISKGGCNDKRDDCTDQRNVTEENYPEISREEASQLHIPFDKAKAINGVLRQHFQTDNRHLLGFCRKNGVDIHALVENAKFIMAEWARNNSWSPDKYPDRSTESELYEIDKLSLNRICSV